VDVYKLEATVGQHGEVVLTGLPFEPGQIVEVRVTSIEGDSSLGAARSLQHSVLEYHDPVAPVAEEEWEALR
jgi:hypothetical protein